MEIVGLTERQLKELECEILSKLGLITKSTTDMTNTRCDEFLDELKGIFSEDPFKNARKIIREHFGIKDIFVVKGDFSKSEVTRQKMVQLLFDSVNRDGKTLL